MWKTHNNIVECESAHLIYNDNSRKMIQMPRNVVALL